MLTDQQKPVIFLAFANDRQDQTRYLRNLPEELRRVRERLKVVEDEGLCEVVVRTNTTVREMLDVFQDKRYRNRIAVFHFGGHAGGFQLLVESASGSPELAHAEGLADFLGQQNGLQLVFLNGCSTEPQVEGLLEANIPSVIATSESIEDNMAMELSSRFYAGLAGGASIQTAYRVAVAAVKTIRGNDKLRNSTKRSDTPVGSIEINTRDFFDLATTATDRWPWDLYVGEGSEIVKTWNLPEASGDSLFGLPALPKQDLPQNPYRHLHWFGEEEAELFFGRGREIRALFEMVTCADDAPIILFYGQTGVGKSSLLASGLLPRLKRTHKELYVRQQIELGLMGTLALGLNIQNPADATADMIKQAWLWQESKEGRPLVVVLDQVEEIFTRLSPEQLVKHLAAFLDVLKHLFMVKEGRPEGKLILGFRKEWLPDIEAACKDARLYFSKFFLKRLDRNGTLEAIEGISRSERLQRQYGLHIEEGLSVLIADDLLEDPESPLAPTLQILLTKMWLYARQVDMEEPAFTAALYHSLKQRGILLSDFLNEQLADINERYPEISENGLVLDVLARHTTPLGTAATCAIEDLFDIYDHQKKHLPGLLKEFQELYLVVPVEQQVNGMTDQATRLAHDTLAPLVRHLYRNSDRAGQRALRILENRTVEWDEGQMGTPLDEADLKLVEAGRPGMHDWTNDEQRLILSSQRSRARRQRVRNWARMAAVAAVALITVFAFYARIQQGLAEQREEERIVQAEIAEKNAQEAIEAKALAEQRQAEALHQQLLAEANAEKARLQEALAKDNADEALRQKSIAETNEEEARRQEQIARASEQEAARQQQIAIENAQRADAQRDIAEQRAVEINQQRRRTLGLALSNKAALRLSSDDKKTAALLAREAYQFNKESSGEFINEVYDALRRTLNAVDKDKGGPLTIHPSHEDWVRTVGYSPVDEWVASAGNDGNVYLWSAKARPDEAIVLPAHRRTVVRELQFNPNGNLLATVGDDHQLRIWENQNREFEEIDRFDIQGGIVRGLAFRPEGNQIALAPEGNAIYILPVRGDTSRPPLSIATEGYVVQSLSFSRDGRWLVAGDDSGYLHVWSWDNLTGQPMTVQAHRGAVRTVAFNNNFLVSGGEDTKVGLWRIDSQGTPKLIEFLRGHSGPVNAAAFSPDGAQLATGSADQTVRLWNVERAGVEAPVILKEHSSWIESVSFSADGRTLVSGGADRTVRIWRINPEELADDICKAVPQSLSEADWKIYAGDGIEYPDSCKSTDPAQTTTALD